MQERGRWSTIEHTADLAVEVEAPSLQRLFVTAARALVGVICGLEGSDEETRPSAEPALHRELALDAEDTDMLLVEWLRELLYIQSAEGLLFADAEVSELSERRLAARVGLSRRPSEGEVERELKGVTYHDLEVSARDGGWYARVVFDV